MQHLKCPAFFFGIFHDLIETLPLIRAYISIGIVLGNIVLKKTRVSPPQLIEMLRVRMSVRIFPKKGILRSATIETPEANMLCKSARQRQQ